MLIKTNKIKIKFIRPGFTIVELLIVIVIIGILATLTIVAYGNIQARARIAVISSDLEGAAKQLAMASIIGADYPNDIALLNNGKGLPASGGTNYEYTYTSATKSYCLTASNGKIAYHISSDNNVPTPGVCTGHRDPGVPANGGVVTSLAGSGISGFADGIGAAAKFSQPAGIASDSTGNIYVSDTGNYRIRKISPTGTVSTLAGGSGGYANGTGASAQFSTPRGLTVDPSGNVYVADYSNNRIRKITSAGVVTTLAGSGANAYADGNGETASFKGPYDVASDSSGNVYVADTGNNRIRKITPAGDVTTIAGSGAYGSANGTGTAATFWSPFGLASDSSGNLYVADTNNAMVRRISSSGYVVSTLAGSTASGYLDGTGVAAKFGSLKSVAVDSSGNVYVADDNRIRKVTSAGVVTTLAGSGTGTYANGIGTAASFYIPGSVAVDSSGNVYVADTYNNRIRKIE